MSTTEAVDIASLLSGYFRLRGTILARSYLASRLEAIVTLDDLAAIDRNALDPLWEAVPQIALHRFGQQIFQAFEPHHKLGQSFIFVHPAHRHAVGSLKEALQKNWSVGEETTRPLTPKLINVLYGGYPWHAAYSAGCRHRGDLNQPATILCLPGCSHDALRELIRFKNASRGEFSKEIIVSGGRIGESMDAIIRAFHCPDVIENTRQFSILGVAADSMGAILR